MTYEEIIEGWKNVFILVLEETSDQVYNQVEEIIKPYSETLKKMIEYEAPLNIIIGVFILAILFESKGIEKLEKEGEYVDQRVNDFWVRYLKKPTCSYLKKIGISPIKNDNLNISVIIKKIEE